MHTKAYHECLQVLWNHHVMDHKTARDMLAMMEFFSYFCITEKLALQEKAVKGDHIST